jgi:hypothetical protein
MVRTTSMVSVSPKPRTNLQKMCQALRLADQDIVEIVQFGSSVYAPDLARDVDLMVTTRARKDEEVYWEALAGWEGWVDLVVREPGQTMGHDLALSVYTFGRSLYGNGETLKEAKEFMAVPTYEDACKLLIAADEDISLAHQAEDEFFRDRRYRTAFDTLFDAARYAAMTFLGTEEARWGYLRQELPSPFNSRFRELINTLHIQYSYDGNYPREMADEVYARWRQTVECFIDDLERSDNENHLDKRSEEPDEGSDRKGQPKQRDLLRHPL